MQLFVNSTQVYSLQFYISIDYVTFGEVIVQRPWRRKSLVLPSRLTMADRAYLREQTQFYFDKIMRVLQEMPRPMLLFVR